MSGPSKPLHESHCSALAAGGREDGVEITRVVAAKVLEVVDAGLSNGLGTPELGQMCVEAAVCYALGLPHGDNPPCVSDSLRSLKIVLNDAEWSSKKARAKGLRRLALAQLGSAGVLNELEFAKRVALMTVQQIVPRALLLARSLFPESSPHFAALAVAAMACAGACDLSAASRAASRASWAASEASEASEAASWAASWVASWASRAASEVASRASEAASEAASWAASWVASWASRAASWAASWAASRAASRAASEAASWVASRASRAASEASEASKDAELAFFAEQVVQILIAMDAPGCQWLDLAPVEVTV